MKILILSSSREEINPYYKSIARSIAQYLAPLGDLIYGAASSSMMGICYDEFVKHNKTIYAYTTPKYIDDLDNLLKAEHFICRDTFEMKQKMFENADLIICLPGGPGTISELTSYIEEKRSNDVDKPIIIYDESNYFKYFYEMYDNFTKQKFASKDIFDMYEVAHNKIEFENLVEEIIFNRKKR